MTWRRPRLVAWVVIAIVGGCAKSPPKVVPVSGVLLLDGQPLPQAKIEFIPDLADFGTETNSSAISDDQGRFTLANVFTRQPGAAVARHHVIVTEAPTPREFRSPERRGSSKIRPAFGQAEKPADPAGLWRIGDVDCHPSRRRAKRIQSRAEARQIVTAKWRSITE